MLLLEASLRKWQSKTWEIKELVKDLLSENFRQKKHIQRFRGEKIGLVWEQKEYNYD